MKLFDASRTRSVRRPAYLRFSASAVVAVHLNADNNAVAVAVAVLPLEALPLGVPLLGVGPHAVVGRLVPSIRLTRVYTCT